jgi:GNAT superfamily N-acetyltransferase
MKTRRVPRIAVVPSDAMRDQRREELLSLCTRAYGEDFSSYLRLLSPAVHVLAYVDGKLVSHAAWVERQLHAEHVGPLRTAYVEAVATLPDHQGEGYASAVLSKIPSLVGDFALAALSPSDQGYYRRLGWELWEGPLSYRSPTGAEIPTPEEQVMIYRLPLTPVSLDLRARLSTDWRPGEVW